MRRARDAARAEWRHALKARRWHWLNLVAVAAMVAGVGGAAWILKARTAPPADRSEIAMVQQVIGAVRVSDAAVSEALGIASPNARIRTADRLETGEQSGAAIRYFDGPSVRLSAGT